MKSHDELLPSQFVNYRFVSSLKSKGIDRVNSKAISDALQIDSATIRRDFSYFGELAIYIISVPFFT
jgi:NADH/NAD ratio-sensing transcriptional regulator Rex